MKWEVLVRNYGISVVFTYVRVRACVRACVRATLYACGVLCVSPV